MFLFIHSRSDRVSVDESNFRGCIILHRRGDGGNYHPNGSWINDASYFPNLCCNQFIGTVPTEIGLLTQLSLLGLSNNQLSGTIPSTLGNLVQLSYLYLYSNPQLTGIIPSTLDSNNGINMYVDCANIRCQYCKDATASDGGCSRN